MDTMKQICLLLICHGFYLGSVCQQWTYPERITALIGSCVEIPCTYYPARISGVSSIVWYLSIDGPDPEILNTKDSSSIRINYKGRTSLVPGDKSCSLRIDPVRGEDNRNFYYPWIAEDGTMNELYRQASFVLLSVRGEATIVRCSVEHTCRSNSPSLQWDKPGQVHNQSVKISEGFWREESNLTFIPSYEENWTLVRCTATYPDGRSFHESRTLTILDKPTNVTITVLGMGEVMEGSDVTLQCNSFSKRRQVKKYEWYKGKDKTKLPEIGREITVRKVTWDMEPYSCAAINDADGRGESALTEIPVLYAAIGVHMTVKNEGEFTELICDFLSSRPDVTHYTWMKYGSILQSETEKTLSVGNNVENYGKYSCIAHNRAGDSSSKEFLHMDERRSPPQLMEHRPKFPMRTIWLSMTIIMETSRVVTMVYHLL
ncbi:sialoadhesin-like isoform X2 [Phyllobates terribilis]|uniref:sialoadhesin-like isoform X2 n=1 Tax=Phyllobates terribilis TaxID=111132 RepID=UPI003CCA8E30